MKRAKKNDEVKALVEQVVEKIPTMESTLNVPIIIFQDGVSKSYYIKCNIMAKMLIVVSILMLVFK